MGKVVKAGDNLSEAKPRPLSLMYYVYVLQRQLTKQFYIGYTADLRRRLAQHQRKQTAQLIYYEAYVSEKIARTRERKLKSYGSAWAGLKKRIIK